MKHPHINGYPTAAIANLLLAHGRADGRQDLDRLTINALVYYAHAWSLALHGRPLIDEPVYAATWGPEILSLRDHPAMDRPHTHTEIVRVLTAIDGGGYGWVVPDPVPKNIIAFVAAAYLSHRHLTGIQLTNSTHAGNEPWAIVRKAAQGGSSLPVIPNAIIEAVFAAKDHATAA